MSGTILGSVASGDPIATTLGNTLRLKAYMAFIAYKAKIP